MIFDEVTSVLNRRKKVVFNCFLAQNVFVLYL